MERCTRACGHELELLDENWIQRSQDWKEETRKPSSSAKSRLSKHASALARQLICFGEDAAPLFKCRELRVVRRRSSFFPPADHRIHSFQVVRMPERDQKVHESGALPAKLAQDQEDDYDVYLFWPSLSNRDVSSEEPPSSPLYGPVSLYSESTADYSYPGPSSGPPSPLTFGSAPDFRFPSPVELLDLGDVPSSEPQPQAPKESSPPKYSPMFKMGLFFSQITDRFDRAIDGVKIKLRKPKPRALEPTGNETQK